MVTNENNSLINLFIKGMNSDTSLDLIENQLYIFGENIRITTNNLIQSLIDSNSTEGIVSPVAKPVNWFASIYKYDSTKPQSNYWGVAEKGIEEAIIASSSFPAEPEDIEITGILATASIEDLGIIIVRYNLKSLTNLWAVLRVEKRGSNYVGIHCIFKAGQKYPAQQEKFSVVLNKETTNIHKLYIADGVHEILQLSLTDETGKPNREYIEKNIQVDQLISNHLFPINPVKIVLKISGNLRTSQIQYCYRYYKKNGIYSKLSPLTNKIQVIDPSHTKEIGNAEDTKTSIGFRIKISNDSTFVAPFDCILIYRLSYVKANQNAEVELIFDGKIEYTSDAYFEDTGEPALQSLSIEEFSALNSQNLIPKVLELNQNYLFAANVKDVSMIRVNKDEQNKFIVKSYDKNHNEFNSEDNPSVEDGYLYDKSGNFGGSNDDGYISYRLVTTDVNIHNDCIFTNGGDPIVQADEPPVNNIQRSKNIIYLDDKKTSSSIKTTNAYFHDRGILCDDDVSINYDNIFTSSLLRSLRRDEVYRYGIVLYDRYGRRSDVLYMADVRVPSMKLSDLSRIIDKHGNIMYEDGSISGQSIPNPTITTCVNSFTTYNFYESDEDRNIRFGKDYNADYDNSIYSIENKNLSENSIEVRAGETYSIYRDVEYEWYYFDSYSGDPVYCKMNEDQFYRTYGVKLSFDQRVVNFQGYTRVTDHEIENNIQDPSNPIINNITERIFVCVNNVRPVYGTTYSYPERFENIRTIVTYTIKINRSADPDDQWQDGSIRDCSLYANPIGIEFNVNLPSSFVEKYDIVGYLIVRCEKSFNYTKNILQCALERPVRQLTSYWDDSGLALTFSPYYPLPFLTSQRIEYTHIDDYPYDKTGDGEYKGVASNEDNYTLYLLFSPEILYQRQDMLSMLSQGLCEINIVSYRYGNDIYRDNLYIGSNESGENAIVRAEDAPMFYIKRDLLPFTYDNKSELSYLFFDYFNYAFNESRKLEIKHISDVKNPNWLDGFSSPALDGKKVLNAIKQYKSFEVSVGNSSYVNWVCSNMYDMRVGENDQGEFTGNQRVFTYPSREDRKPSSMGWIGPGPVCFVVNTDKNERVDTTDVNGKQTLGTFICNIQHPWAIYSGTTEYQKLYDIYYGFGNFTPLTVSNSISTIFDGDVYIMPYEFVSMFKAYDFNSIYDSLPSTLVVYYIPMESRINGCFDYGMNYRNTQNKNLMLEPGNIVGVASQDRPLHSYNPIYSDNNTSNDVFNAQSLIEYEHTFQQRAVYSELKTNGELIDSWGIFKSANLIDVDSRYGEITNLLTANDILYYWLNSAFGKFSVNERSLVTDLNSNTIQLGQSGVLLRNDYIDTTYGMRYMDFSAIAVANDIYWIDILNKAVVSHRQGSVINYGERLNVQNIINKYISNDIPQIDYDVLNNELLCLMFDINKNEYSSDDSIDSIKAQLVFNTKYDCATSIYTREYIDTMVLENKLLGVNGSIEFSKFNYIENEEQNELLSPTILSFVVNKSSSSTKVFDNQQIISLKRIYDDNFVKDYLKNKYYTFTTDILDAYYGNVLNERITDREGNILYAVPRCNIDSEGNKVSTVDYGRRMRGKWMRVDIRDDNPKYEFSISHIITKFRQSYS